MGARDVCVDLRGRNVGVTEHLLYRADVSVVLDQMRRKRMPQRMGRNTYHAALLGVLRDRYIYRLPVYR